MSVRVIVCRSATKAYNCIENPSASSGHRHLEHIRLLDTNFLVPRKFTRSDKSSDSPIFKHPVYTITYPFPVILCHDPIHQHHGTKLQNALQRGVILGGAIHVDH